MSAWTALNGKPPLDRPTINVPSLTPYLIGQPVPPTPNEQGWKDTVQAYTGEVTVIRIRFTQQDGTQFPFNPTAGPGYVWHCHLLEHEDDDMMRPYVLFYASQSQTPVVIISAVIILIVAVVLALLIYRRHAKTHVLNAR